jgi:hypothetical protein
MALDVTRKGEVPVRLFDIPFLLKFGGSLSIIYKQNEVRCVVAL